MCPLPAEAKGLQAELPGQLSLRHYLGDVHTHGGLEAGVESLEGKPLQ